jgi:ribosome-interacting GTPase 1
MPANLSPMYYEAEERFRQAREIDEKIACLEEMLRQIPKHKGTEKMQADIKTRLAKLRRQPKKKGAARGPTHMVRKEGAAQVALLGPPNTGKSALVRRLTHAHPEVADYPFTTRQPVPGMMSFEEIAFQLIDLPALSREHVEPWVYDIVRTADLIWFVVDVANSLDGLNDTVALLEEKHIKPYPAGETSPESPGIGWLTKPSMLVVTGMDRPEGPDDLEILKELLERPWPLIAVSATEGTQTETLGKRTFEVLDLVRVFTKQPGKPADREAPFTFRRGATIEDLAQAVHKEVLAGLKYAKVWGEGVYDGQTVQRDHLLCDGDVVEIHS